MSEFSLMCKFNCHKLTTSPISVRPPLSVGPPENLA